MIALNRMRIWAIGLIAWGGMLIPLQAQAQSSPKRVALGLSLSAGYVFPLNAAHHSHLDGRGALVIGLSPILALEVEGTFSMIPTESQPSSLGQGHLFHLPVLLNIRFRLPVENFPVAAFLKVGGGYAFNIMKLNADMVKDFEALGFEVSEACDPAAVLQAGAGLEVIFSEKMAVEVFGLYRISEAKGEWIITDTVTGSRASGTIDRVNLKALAAGLGLRFNF